MIQVYIHLDKSSYLFKTMKKKRLLEGNTLFIWLKYKPNIGELIEISSSDTRNGNLRNYLSHRKPLLLRIVDLVQSYTPTKDPKNCMSVMELKVYEDTRDWQRSYND